MKWKGKGGVSLNGRRNWSDIVQDDHNRRQMLEPKEIMGVR